MNQLQKRDYFYLISSLPEMVLDQSRAPFKMVDFVAQLEEVLEPQDFAQVSLLLYPHDNRNLLRLLQENTEDWDPLGRFAAPDMQNHLKAESGLPAYMHRFYRAYQNEQPPGAAPGPDNQLSALYYSYALHHSTGFLHEWLAFERSLRNLLTAWNIRQYSLRTEGQLIGKGEEIEALQKSRARDFGLSTEYAYLHKLFNELEREDLMAREKAIDRIQWNYINEQLTFHYFTIEVVLGYLLQLQMLQRWLSLDPQAGQERVRNFISEMEQKITLA
ncbi:MAG: DUF2764 family protein [Phaeodactylibacter sp.]|uniref:DUF2764 family protein n=1 Tax=Phaeodactylibacter sp. TaxID=1940289 RepID=UPI0032EF1AB6